MTIKPMALQAPLIKLSSILLFALIVPFIMSVRLSPGDTPFWLFGLIFLGLFSYTVIDFFKISEDRYFQVKSILLWLLILATIGSAFFSSIVVRHIAHPTYQIHDMPLQQEIAVRFLLDGKNPYATTYFGTFLEQWHYVSSEVNPALYHFVLMPFYILFAITFYFVSVGVIGYWDARMPLLFLFLLSLVVAFVVPKVREQKLLFTTLLAFNPAMLTYTLEGRSDFFMFGFLILALYLLYKERLVLAGVPMALAFVVKQSAWPIFPFYFAYLFFKHRTLQQSTVLGFGVRHLVHSFAQTIKLLLPFVVTFLVIVAPFFFWDARAFLDSTIFYLSGSALHSYPISGYGFGMLLNEAGVINDLGGYYPFQIWQAIIGIPALIFLIRYLWDNLSVRSLILTYGIFLFIFWYFSRYFNNSHVGYLSMVFITAYFWPFDSLTLAQGKPSDLPTSLRVQGKPSSTQVTDVKLNKKTK